MKNPKSQYYQYYQINPNFKIPNFRFWILDFGFIWNLVVFGFGSILILGMFALAGCAEREEIPELEKAEILEQKEIEQQVLQFDLTAYTDRGMKRWEVRGKSADVVGQIVELTHVIATTYGEENTSTLQADGGTYNKVLNKVHLEKNVLVTTGDGARILTDAMDWDSQNNIITTDRLVKIERDQITLWGKHVKGEPELKQARFGEEIRIEMDDGATVITCDGPLDIDYEKNLAIFNSNVKIVDEKGEVTSNRLDAYLNPETKVIVKAIAKGEVKILRNDNYSYSDEATYLTREHKVILTGRPKIVIYPDEKLDTSLFTGDINE